MSNTVPEPLDSAASIRADAARHAALMPAAFDTAAIDTVRRAAPYSMRRKLQPPCSFHLPLYAYISFHLP